MSEEARHTERHNSCTSDLKLRHSRVAFINAGASPAEHLDPITKKSETTGETTGASFQERNKSHAEDSQYRSKEFTMTPDAQMSNLTLDSPRPTLSLQKDSEEEAALESKQGSIERWRESTDSCEGTPLFKNKDADESRRTDLAAPSIGRSSSPTNSDMSGEVIIFAGRHRSCIKGDHNHISDAGRAFDARNVSKVSKPGISLDAAIGDPKNVEAQRISSTPEQGLSGSSFPDRERAPRYLSCCSRGTTSTLGPRRRSRYLTKEAKDDKFLDDYAANARDGFDLEALNTSFALSQRHLSGASISERQDEVESLPLRCVKRDPSTKSEELDSADSESFSEREVATGAQYLVNGSGCTTDDAPWFSVSSLISQGAGPLVQEFEGDTDLDYLRYSSIGYNASPVSDEHIAQDPHEDSTYQKDEMNLKGWSKARVRDEKVARLLSKQEELGLGSDDLMLFDGNDVGVDSTEETELDGLWKRARSHRAPFKSKANTQVIYQSPYVGFDVMDQQISCLHKNAKGRREKFSLKLSDSELEQSIHTTWENDRIKKKKRRQEREELRMQGLLGKKNKLDLKTKYSEGISMSEVKKEIRDFLSSSMERYTP